MGRASVIGTPPEFFVPTSTSPDLSIAASGIASAAGQVATTGHSIEQAPNLGPFSLTEDVAGYPLDLAALPSFVTAWSQLKFLIHWSHGPRDSREPGSGIGWGLRAHVSNAPVTSITRDSYDTALKYSGGGSGGGDISSQDPDSNAHVGIDIATVPGNSTSTFQPLAPVSAGLIGSNPWIYLEGTAATLYFFPPHMIYVTTILDVEVIWDEPKAGKIPPLRLNPRHDKRLYPPTRSRGVRPTGYL